MAFFDCHFFSDTLGLSVSAYVLLPQKTTRLIGMVSGEQRERYPTIYLLHGLSDDHTIWMRRTSIERYAAVHNVAVVMPAAGRSCYQDMARGPRYWTFVSEELPALCRQWFPLSAEREDNFAAGLSMGGYGALRLALAAPERFAAAASLSGALDLARRARQAGRKGALIGDAEWLGIFGPQPRIEGGDSDLYALAGRSVASGREKPHIYLACGTEDGLIYESRRFREHVEQLGFDCVYDEGPGAHDWAYWDAQIERVIEWLPIRKIV